MTGYSEAVIEADSTVPIIRINRDFHATPAQLLEAHTDPTRATPNWTSYLRCARS
jgi:hypothetical protein